MTRYAYDAERCTLVATWGSGVGELASDVPARLEEVPMEEAQHLAAGLTNLSSALWWAYTHPASSADSLELNSEGWRREQERAAFGDVLTALRSPNLPHDDGILRSYSPIQEAAHTVGRVLHALDDHSVTNAVCADVAEELAAVERRTRQPDRARPTGSANGPR